MTSSELAGYDGRNGQPAYVAVSGTIYDVSESPKWTEGDHLGAHQAGADLTEELKSAPHVRAVIERFPVVGKLEADQPAATDKKSATPLIIGLVLLAVAIIIAFSI